MWPASVLGPLLHGSSAMRHGSSNTAKEMEAELLNQGWVLCLQAIQACPRGQRMTLFRSSVPLSVCVGGRSKEKKNKAPALRCPVPVCSVSHVILIYHPSLHPTLERGYTDIGSRDTEHFPYYPNRAKRLGEAFPEAHYFN